jgi:cell wall-associated NlpC family hydrolase
VSIDPIFSAPPVVVQLQAQFAALSPSSPSGLPSPSDPFAVLLAAASATSVSAASTGSSLSAASLDDDSTTTSVEPQLVSLASSSTGTATALGASSTASGSAVVSEAEKFLGVPYVWGGSSPGGFDCSGLVQYVFAQLGVELPRGSVDQSEVGTPVASLAEAQPGDLLFFEPGQNGAPPGKPGHVGIYIGDGQMIDAPETGENVQIQAVPCTPIAIRRISVPGAATSVSAGDDDVSVSGGAVQMGSVSVPAQYAGMVEKASAQSGTPASLLAAILYDESRFQPDVVSSAGAEGIAQFMPATAAANGVSPFDPASAIRGAADLLSQYHAAFGSWTDAIAAYAAGGGAVEAAGGVPQDGSTPAYVAQALAEAGMAPGS